MKPSLLLSMLFIIALAMLLPVSCSEKKNQDESTDEGFDIPPGDDDNDTGDDDDNDTYEDPPEDNEEDDSGEDCDLNTAPTFEDTVWIVNGGMELYPESAIASTSDVIGVGFIWEDEECNLIGGQSTFALFLNNRSYLLETTWFDNSDIGCSTAQSLQLIGYFFDSPLPTGTYEWIFFATDICDATSNTMTGTFTIVE